MRKKFHRFKRKYQREQQRQTKRLKRASRHPYAVPIFTFLILLAISFVGYFYLAHNQAPATDARVVIISYDHHEQTVPSIEPTVGKLLNKLAIKLGQGDVVEPSLATAINQDDFRINIYRAVPVEVIDGGQKTFTFSAATTPRAIARQTGSTIYPEDDVQTKPITNFLTDYAIGEQVVIDRATPVNLNLYGTPLNIRTHAATVGELIKEKKIHLAKDDQVIPAAATPLAPNTQVFVVRNGITIQSETQTIAMPVQRINDNSLAYGTSAIRQQGSPGTQVVTYQVTTQNGKETGRTAIQTVVTQSAVTQIVVVGTNLAGIKGDMALAGISPSDYTYADYIISHESGWCPTKAQGEHYCPSVPDNQFTSGGYGLCQATPGSKMASAGADWATNPITQLKWCSGYAQSRYGGWYAAYEHWLAHSNW